MTSLAPASIANLGRRNDLPRQVRGKSPQPVYFTQEDPVGLAGGLNLYGYAGGDPINYSDPFGLCPKPDKTANSICISFFISAPTAGRFKGDDREASTESEVSRSRVWINIDVDARIATGAANKTCDLQGNCLGPDAANRIGVTFGGDGSINVDVRARNPFVPGVASGLMDINASMTLTPDGSGGFILTGARDGYPSFEAYHWRNGQASELSSQDERTPRRLLPPMDRRIP